jgi:hypothetical protein
MELIIAVAAASVIALLIGIIALWRSMSFGSRVDRRSRRREEFKASWGAILRDAELAARDMQLHGGPKPRR